MIERIKISNYKTILDAELKLGPLTVLVGANNTGKSNLLEVFGKIGKISENGMPHTFGNTEFGAIFPKNKIDKNDSIRIKVDFSAKSSKPIKGMYSINLCPSVKSEFLVFSENLTLDGSKHLIRSFTKDNRVYRQFKGQDDQLPSKETKIEKITATEDDVSRYLKSRRFYLDPKAIKSAEHVNNGNVLGIEETGKGTALVVDELASRLTNKHKSFMELIRSFAPEIENITAPDAKRGQNARILAITEAGMDEAVTGDSISDGLACMIATIAAFEFHRDASIFCIEEPENGIHPRRLRELVTYFKRLTETNNISSGEALQLIITTHSPYILDEFHDMPEAVIFVDRSAEKGTFFTRLTEVLDKKKEYLEEKLKGKATSLGDLWFNGFLGGVPR